MLLLKSVWLLASAAPALSALYYDPTELPSTIYDYVVVGAGVGGGVVASRLAEHGDKRVLLIEAGPDNQGLENVAVPFLCTTLSPDTAIDWNYTTVPQAGLSGRTIEYPRGRLLGGSSSINFLVWSRGARDDYDRLAEVSGDAGWSWSAVEPIFKKIERLTPPADGHNTSGEELPSVHGRSGPLGISVGNAFPTDALVRATTRELPEFPFNVDMNSGNTLGIGRIQTSVSNGSRSSSATAYIHPALAVPHSTLDVLVNAQVTKLMQTGKEGGVPVFRGVQFATSEDAPVHTVTATHEVILATGAVSTPQLLLLSGIGNASSLRTHGILPIVDLPDVGQHLQDHPVLRNVFTVNSSVPTNDDLVRNASQLAASLAEWEADRKGPYASTSAEQVGWLRVSDDVLRDVGDVSAGPGAPHFELILVDGYSGVTTATGRYFTIRTAVVSPSSRGSVTLASSAPFALPIVDPNFLSTPADIIIMREAVKAVLRFTSSPAFAAPPFPYILGPLGALANVTTDVEIDAYARDGSTTLWHPTGTARMAAAGAKEGVVGPDLR
ncbi:GMC oxidoreductase, partial [Auriscalpium vulgare]